MKPELDESLSRFHAAIVGGASAEEAARAMPVSEVPVSSLLETFPVLTWATTPDGVPCYLNQRCIEYTGRSLSDFLRLGWADLIHPEDREETLRTWLHAVQSGSSHHAKHRIRRADGEYRWFLARGEPLRDHEGRVIQFFGLSMDIDESVKREAEIRRLFDANIVGIMFWDLDGGIRDANDAFLRMIGYERADLVSGRLRWTDLTPPEWLRRDREYAEQEARLTGSVQPYEKEFFRKDGSRVPVLIGGAAFDEEIKHGVAFVVDITERKRAALALADSEARFRNLTEISADFYWETDAEHRYSSIEFGKAYVGIRDLSLKLGRARWEIPSQIPSPTPDEAGWAAHRAVCDAHQRIVDFGFSRMENGTERFYEISGEPRFDARGGFLGYRGVGRDVTERRRAELALRKSEERYACAMEASGDGHADWNIETGELYVSPRYLEICGLPRDTTFRDRAEWVQVFPFHPEDRAKWETAVAAHLASRGTRFREEMRIVVRGETRWLEVTYVCRRDAAGRPIRWTSSSHDITERKRVEEELRRSQHYLAEAQKVSHTGSWAWSPVSNAILYWSEECYRILGYDPAQGLPSFESSFERIHPEDRPALAETIERAVREKAEFQIEYRLVLPNGTRRNVRILSHPVLDACGKLVEFVGTVMDVTEQKWAKQERRAHLWFLESMDRINRAMQRSNDVELMTSGVMQEALEIFACDRACLSYPCDADTPTYRTVMEHTSPEYDGVLTLGQDRPMTPEWAEVTRRALHHPEAVVDPSLPPGRREPFRIGSMLAIAVRPKGDRPYLFVVHSARSRPWTAAELRLFEETARRLGDALTSVLAHRNLLASQEELCRSRAYLAEAQKVSHTGSWAWNNVREIVYWSEECFRIHGRDPAQGLPSLEQILADIHPDDVPEIVASLEKALREGRGWELEYRMVNFADGPRTIRTIAHPVPDRSGRVVEYIGTVVDITEQKRAEQELRTSELERARAEHALRDARERLAQASKIASLAELSASIAHEINQPLQAIVANGHASLRWLDATPPNIEKAIRTAKRVVRDGNAAADVVSRIRALFRHTAPAKADLDINKLILEVRTLMADEIEGNGVSFETELGEDLPRIGADAVQIQQVIVNLVRNAIEAMAEARRKPLLIRSRRSEGHVAVDVRDQGTGLVDPEKIFEPFVSTKETGMGMGLTICRSIIEAHAGDIRVVHNEGPGVTFSFSLPIEASDAQHDCA